MRRDASTGRRGAVAIPGWLLIFYSLAAIVYAEHFRSRSDFCPDGTWVLIDGTCYTVWKLVLPLLLIGIGLAVAAATAFRAKPSEPAAFLRHGTPTHVVLSLLISLVLVPLLFLLIQLYRQSANDRTYVVELLGVDFEHIFLLELAILVALLMLIPYVVAIWADCRRRKQMVAANDSPAEVDDEPKGDTLPHEAGFVHPDSATEEWPASREPEPAAEKPAVAISVRSTPKPAAQPAKKPASAKPATAKDDATVTSYRVATSDVEEIEGIGPKFGATLKKHGIHTYARLVAEPADVIAERTGISAAYIDPWQRMAELTAVNGIGPQYAEALVLAGVHDVSELQRRSAGSIAKQVSAYLSSLDKHILGTGITETRVEGWKKAAKGMRKVSMPMPKR